MLINICVKLVPGTVDSLMGIEISIKKDLLHARNKRNRSPGLADFLIDHKH